MSESLRCAPDSNSCRPLDLDVGSTTSQGAAATHLVGGSVNILQGLTDIGGPAADLLEGTANAIGGASVVLGFIDHLENGPPVAEGRFDSMRFAAAHTLADVLSPTSPGARVARATASLTADDPRVALATRTVADALPSTTIGDGLHAAIDAYQIVESAVIGDPGRAFRQADVVQDSALHGAYGPVVQAATMGAALASEPERVGALLTSDEAADGALGPFVALGNRIGDAAYELFGR